jgi:hypothetical protein
MPGGLNRGAKGDYVGRAYGPPLNVATTRRKIRRGAPTSIDIPSTTSAPPLPAKTFMLVPVPVKASEWEDAVTVLIEEGGAHVVKVLTAPE